MALASLCDVMSVLMTVAGMCTVPALGIHFAVNKTKVTLWQASFIKPVMLLVDIFENVNTVNKVICSLALKFCRCVRICLAFAYLQM
jgi:hypothetical protein